MVDRMLSRALTDKELDKLNGFLSRIKGAEIPNVEALDGFLTALVICPELVKPSEYFPVITSGETEDDDLVFKTTAEAEGFYGLISRHWNDINRTFRSGDFYMPIMDVDEAEEHQGNDWAAGFLRGTQMRYYVWDPIIQDDERGGVFVALYALAHEHADDPSLRPFIKPLTSERRKDLLAMIIAGVKRLYDEFSEDQSFGSLPVSQTPTFRPKVGRNEPCPCGSGKKFKKCCGQATTYH